MIWYDDKKIRIEFDNMPHTAMLYPLPSMNDKEKEGICKKPFVNKTRLFVTVTDKRGKEIEYKFMIEKGYRWDGGTIPRMFWRLIGSNTQPEFQIPSMIHDYLCENKECINNDRLLSSKVFKGLLLAGGVGKFKAQTMFLAVDNWQKLCNWKKD